MIKFFELLEQKDSHGKTTLSLGIRVNIAGHETIIPILEFSDSQAGFEEQVRKIADGLEGLIKQGKEILGKPRGEQGLGITAATPADAAWSILLSINDQVRFMDGFNGLEESKRREIAEHVLTCCNVFSGRAALFSSHYHAGSGLLE